VDKIKELDFFNLKEEDGILLFLDFYKLILLALDSFGDFLILLVFLFFPNLIFIKSSVVLKYFVFF
jgi:hypothetical protein